VQTDSVEARAVAVGRSGVVVSTLVGCAGVAVVGLLGATLDAVLAEHAHETTNTKREPGDTSDDTRL